MVDNVSFSIYFNEETDQWEGEAFHYVYYNSRCVSTKKITSEINLTREGLVEEFCTEIRDYFDKLEG